MVKIIKVLTPIVAIFAIVALECFAISKGLNGTLLAGALVIIAGLAGYEVKALKDIK